ncbi:MAG TPA: TIGR03808 family TAT-translocated repetitive protein, partial [Rhizobiaceae bacterium]|nr:TIGR03808 family TAT-translocated repetitive protein [Rhizobiaceae bacterium]
LHYGGGGHFLAAQNARRITLAGLVLDAGNAWLADHVSGALDLRGVETAVVEDCILLGSAKSGLHLEGSGGRIEACDISGAAGFGLYAVESRGLRIAANTVSACANGGVAVHRWQVAEDGSTIADNRVFDIGAANGGTGQWGNGINVFRANAVSISGNRVSDCAFSAIRANACSDLRVSGNSARNSGETAIYAEFGFEGAAIAGNTVDGAANGISVVNFNDGGRLATVSANIVRNLRTVGPYPADPPGFGVGISVEADTAVTGNVVENAPLYGVNLGWGEFLRDCVASGNVIREARYGVAVTVADGAGAAVIADNRIAARDAAIVGHRWAKIVTGDLAAGGKLPGNVTVERNGVG